ncbi:putative ATPase/DNA-binding CsgD family transcriptional regulator [Crossiella cryophila]|uniref:Putative ATPase/DNA-binding CsgD family transcriptional regulator n=1 Tax=Crossiella cryophila TaxID=43355 RepID=A0A7W7FUL8_9PSEU|nr:putative ATPase/DNA-binding CsgD family transcriptional regulator [Crossiella cryophila]
MSAVASAFGLSDGSLDQSAQLVEHLRDKQLLLLLDNAEHLTESCGELVALILTTSPGVRILLTSRHILGVRGEQILPVPPLEVPELGEPAEVRRQPVVQLFADRAAAVVPNFVVDAGNAELVVRICRTLDGIPLAIEAVVVWLRILTPQELLRRLDRTFQLLNRGNRSAPTRQQTLYATIDWSYTLCSADERLLWERLSIFTGEFDLAAVAALYEGEPVETHELIDLLARLVDKSVITSRIGRPAARFTLLGTLRQFGQLKLGATGDERRIRRRHAAHYRALATRAAHDWLSGGQQERVYQRLTAEHDNLCAAMLFGLEGEDPAAGLELAVSMTYFWLGCGALGEARRWLDLALASNPEPSRDRAHGLWANGHAAVIMGQFEAGIRLARAAEGWAREHGDEPTLAHALLVLGTATLQQGAFEQAQGYCDEALSRFEAVGELTFLGLTLATRSMVATFRGEFQHALAFTEQARDVCARHGERWAGSYAHYSAALLAWIQGGHEVALREVDAGLRIARTLNDLLAAGMLLDLRAWVEESAGRPEPAAELLGVSHAVWPLIGRSSEFGGPPWGSRHEACELQLRKELGDQAFELAFERGVRIAAGLPDAVAHVLGETAAAEVTTAEVVQLSKREREVAELVAGGLSNRDIAKNLGITPRTAETHVNNVLGKLGFSSRARLAAWVTQQRQ